MQMTEVYLVTAEHPTVPGVVHHVCRSHAQAIRRAVELANDILDSQTDVMVDVDLPVATADNWETVLDPVQEWHGEANCYVDIEAIEIED
jgi:hypothetical protein